MKLLITFLASMGFSSAEAIMPDTNVTNWLGTYECHQTLGENVSGVVASSEYIITVDPNHCEIHIQGFQIDEHLICQSDISVNQLTLTFESYSDGSKYNKYGVAVYHQTETLLELTKHDHQTTTHWHALWPGEPVSKIDNCFVKR